MRGLMKAGLAACRNEGRVAWRDMDDETKALMMRHR
jgi:hypothetical protein